MDVIDKKFVKIKYFFPEFFLVHHHMRGIFLSTGEFAKTLTHTVIAGSQRMRHANTQGRVLRFSHVPSDIVRGLCY